eukprot:CAMPEP_0180350686 /NCGR_PEP_ID=MMETSP0989-20121125/6127_1 /TAXON_ID=697907 /ORGANISM="non described non described, Strain CCMP2293" /LENGTH=441 /DNA_ID=CAMNT_0022340077 /DNA_START=98 /DNA_END=1420 /DNA_ORIENTATION=-
MATSRSNMRVLSGQDYRGTGSRIPSSAHRDAGNGVTSGYNILTGATRPLPVAGRRASPMPDHVDTPPRSKLLMLGGRTTGRDVDEGSQPRRNGYGDSGRRVDTAGSARPGIHSLTLQERDRDGSSSVLNGRPRRDDLKDAPGVSRVRPPQRIAEPARYRRTVVSSDYSDSDEPPPLPDTSDDETTASQLRARAPDPHRRSRRAGHASSNGAEQGGGERRAEGGERRAEAGGERRGEREDAFAVVERLGKKQKERPRALVGLSNLGNTCFMNSCLQCLSNTPELTGYFVSNEYAREVDHASKSKQLTLNYAELIQDMWKAGGKNVTIQPSALKMQISKWARQFSGYNQHDSQELLRFLLDGLQEGLMRPKKEPPWPYDDDSFDARPILEQSERMWQNYMARNNSLITQVFCGQLHSLVVCNVCKRESNCYDPFMDLSLPIPK